MGASFLNGLNGPIGTKNGLWDQSHRWSEDTCGIEPIAHLKKNAPMGLVPYIPERQAWDWSHSSPGTLQWFQNLIFRWAPPLYEHLSVSLSQSVTLLHESGAFLCPGGGGGHKSAPCAFLCLPPHPRAFLCLPPPLFCEFLYPPCLFLSF